MNDTGRQIESGIDYDTYMERAGLEPGSKIVVPVDYFKQRLYEIERGFRPFVLKPPRINGIVLLDGGGI